MAQTELKKTILASKVNSLRSDVNEASLKHDLFTFFKDLQDKILTELGTYWNDDFMVQGQIDLILAPIFESQKDYYELLLKYNLKEFHKGQQTAKRLVKIVKDGVNGADKAEIDLNKGFKPSFTKQKELFGTLQYSEDKLRNQTFIASETTMNRIDKEINTILADGYQSGKGIAKVRDNITQRFTQLKTWESERIARTEIHSSQSMGIMNGYENLGVEYIEWDTAHDNRVRGLKKTDSANHVIMDGEIIRFGDTFSNGLSYAGDRTGRIEEWINCRCGTLPFIMPDGYTAPAGKMQFRESEIIKVDVAPISDVVKPQSVDTPVTQTPKQTQKPISTPQKVKTQSKIKTKAKQKQKQPVLTETQIKIKELEKLIKDEQSLADKWRKRGNTELAKTFEANVKQYKEELNNLKKPTTKKPVKTQEEQKQEDIINNALADALKDVGLETEAPARKPINPNVKIDKNIKTTHKSNLWENLAEKHGFELVEASKTKVTFYDKKHETPIRCHISQNSEWIDYTNRGLKKINIEDILTSYNTASTIQKKATPIINLKGKNLDQGNVFIGKDTFEMNLYEGAFYKMEGSINGGNIKGAMHHEMWHCVDIRLTDEYEARVLNALSSNKARSDYKKAVTKDRRIKNKTGGSNFVSSYARQSGSGNKVYEDFAESGSVISSNTFLVQDAVGGYVKVTKKEFIKQYPNRAKYIQDIMDKGKLLW